MPLNDHFLSQWRAAGIKERRASQSVAPPPAAGFSRLYYFTAPEHALSNIIFSRLKVSRFSELNDPFELLGQHFGDRDLRKFVRNNKIEFCSKNGLVCFSEDWNDPVLWSHYAVKHRGVALGFDVRASIAQKVQYSPSRLKYKMPKVSTSITTDLAKELICKKFASWSYEKEWRVLVDLEKADKEGFLYFLPFGRDIVLHEVILGSARDINLKKLRTVVNSGHTGVETFKCRLALRSFQIIPMVSSIANRRIKT